MLSMALVLQLYPARDYIILFRAIIVGCLRLATSQTCFVGSTSVPRLGPTSVRRGTDVEPTNGADVVYIKPLAPFCLLAPASWVAAAWGELPGQVIHLMLKDISRGCNSPTFHRKTGFDAVKLVTFVLPQMCTNFLNIWHEGLCRLSVAFAEWCPSWNHTPIVQFCVVS